MYHLKERKELTTDETVETVLAAVSDIPVEQK